MFFADLPLWIDTLLSSGETLVVWAVAQIEAAFLTLPAALVENILQRWQVAPCSNGGWQHPLMPVAIAWVAPVHG